MTKLSKSVFRTVVRNTPLISIDLIITNRRGEVLLGCRTNEPAKGSWFVPGGRIYKNETIRSALSRIMKSEMAGFAVRGIPKFRGVYEHLYLANFFEEAGFGTHYVVLAYDVRLEGQGVVGDRQHSEFRWWKIPEILRSTKVHRYTKAYFKDSKRRG